MYILNLMKGLIRMAKEKTKKKGGAVVVLLIIIIIAVAAILLFTKGGFGNGTGTGEGVPVGGTLPEPPGTNAADTTALATETSETVGSTVIVEIAGESIYISGTPCESSAALKEFLLAEADGDTSVVLRDNHAVKSVYDEAKAVLDELGLEYSGETVG